MIEQGLVKLIESTVSITNIATVGGFLAELPKGTPLPSWYYVVISDVAQPTLTTFQGLAMRRIEFNCCGAPDARGADAIKLARAMDNLLHGFRGTLDDPDHTRIDSSIRSDVKDFFDSAGRTYRRMIEYEIWFDQDQ